MPANDVHFMLQALAEARKSWLTTRPNPRIGCVLVRDGQVIGRGHTQRAGGGDHAEVGALRQAGDAVRGATAYVTLEPCSHFGSTPPCADALVAAGVARVVAAMTDPFPAVQGAGFQRLRAAGIAVTTPLLEQEAWAMCPGFYQRVTSGRPRVRVKMAASLDGRTALANGVSQWITGPEARADVQKLRAESCAMLTGIGTVLADNPRLTVRNGLPADMPQPLRVVMDSQLRTPPQAQLLQEPGAVLVVGVLPGADDQPLPTPLERRRQILQDAGAEVLLLPGRQGQVDPLLLLEELGRRQCNEVLVEAGAQLAGALLAAALVDELVLYQAAVVLGADGRGLLALPPMATLAETPRLALVRSHRIGTDWRLDLRPV